MVINSLQQAEVPSNELITISETQFEGKIYLQSTMLPLISDTVLQLNSLNNIIYSLPIILVGFHDELSFAQKFRERRIGPFVEFSDILV